MYTMTCEETANTAVDKWYAYQNKMELEFALKVVKNFQPKVILEIGTAYLGSIAAWAEVTKPELLIGIDPMDLPRTKDQDTVMSELLKNYDIKMCKGFTRDPKVQTALEVLLDGRKVDFMFIDAAHGFDDVKHDFYTYKKFLSPDGLVGFHDIYYSEGLVDAGSQVNYLWDRVKARYNYDEIYYHSSMGIGFIYPGRPNPPSSHE